MAAGNENVLSWNVPNVITIWLMLALLWVLMGIGSHFIRKPSKKSGPGIMSDISGNTVAAA